MIIGLAGRKSSGKTTAAQFLLDEYGFERISFAAGLKEYVAILFNWTIDSLNSQEGKEEVLLKAVIWDEYKCKELSELTGEDLSFDGTRTFNTRREALQYIGTDVLRKHNPSFHIDEFKRRLSEGDFVCDDVRFANELTALNEVGAVCCYFVRPYFWDYSNHDSEVSLGRNDFDYVFLNDGSLSKFRRKTKLFIENIIHEQRGTSRHRSFSREELKSALEDFNGDTNKCAERLGCSRDAIVWWANIYALKIFRNKYDLHHDAFSEITEASSYWAGLLSADGSVKKHLKHDYLLELSSIDAELVYGFAEFLQTYKPIYSLIRPNGKKSYYLTVSSPYLIDDLKLWNVEPLKSRFNKIPDCIRHNDEMFSQWLVGLIDGDGSVWITKQGTLGLSVIASKEVIDFIFNWLGFGRVYSEKGIENLFTINFSGKRVVELYRKIYRGVGLKRKWSKIVPYLERW